MNAENNVTLAGFMGAGKSETGLRVANELGLEFYDMDKILVERHGPIDAMFKKHGEHYFRGLESALLRELLAMKGVVISTGGGTLIEQSNCNVAREKSTVVWLKVDYDIAVSRIRNDKAGIKRPNADKRMFERFNFRQRPYERAAHVTVNANGPLNEVVANILRELEHV